MHCFSAGSSALESVAVLMHKEAAIRMSLMSADPQVQVRTRRQNLTKDDECRFTSTIRKVTFTKINPK
jgi:hypothetical protein